MRIIDIYKETGGGIQLVAEGCIQVGDTLIGVSPQSKFFVMSDGSNVCYPVGTAKQTGTVELECTSVQAAAIRAAMHEGSLLFAGMRFGTVADSEIRGYRAFMTGEAEIGQMYAGVNLYKVRLPLLFDAKGTALQNELVPVLQIGSLSIGGESEPPGGYEKVLYPENSSKVVAWKRKGTLFTGASVLELSLTLTRQDGGDFTGMTCTILNGTASVTATVSDNTVTATLPIAPRENLIEIKCLCGEARALRVVIPIYRQGVMA